MPYMLYGMVIAVVFGLLVAAIAVPLCKKFRWGLDAESQITLRPEEKLIASMVVSWKHKAFYLNKRDIPYGILDITNQRLVFTHTSGINVSFALEKADIASVSSAGLFMCVQATDGTRYLLGTSWKKEFKGYLTQMGVPVQ